MPGVWHMILLAIEHSVGLKQITLNYVNMDQVEITLLEDSGSFYVDKSGCKANSIPIAVVVSAERLAECQWKPDPETMEMLKTKAIEEVKKVKTNGKKLVPYRLARKIVSEELPDLKGQSLRRLLDVIRKKIESHK
jgi:hypothetical protein